SVKNKMWPKENFIELIDKIMDFFKTKVNIILTGGPSDVEYIKSMAKEIKIQPLIVAGQTSLSQLCALISRLDLLITNCTAPLHIAELLDIPSVAILGPSLRERWTRRNHRHVVLQTNGLDCCPCEKRWCIFKETVCLTSITVDDVFASTLKLLDESPVP
ncbi:glycosyltransferase family 9 protein, partial [bacterium]|nr:glycosyltransferase family 9 protein [bacterium]